METIYIYNGESRISVPVTDSAERSHSLQQHNYVKLVWKSAENTPILANAYIEYEGQVFYCLDDYFPTHMDGIYEYDIEFHAIEDTFNRPLFFRYVDILDQATGETTSWKEIEWSLNSNLRTIAEIVVDSLNRAYDNAYFALPNDSYADTLLLSYSFASNSIADALSTIAEQNETEWWLETTDEYVDGKRKYILHFDKCELGDTIELNDNYTEDANGVWQSGGLKSVSQSGNTNIIPQKLYVYGSERNIIKKTVEQEVAGGVMNVSYDKKLRLPKRLANNTTIYPLESVGKLLYLNEDSSITISGINNKFEQVKIFDEVYPKMDMTVKGVSVQNPNSENPIYWLKGDRLKSITTENPADDSINPGKLGLLIEGCTLMCTFTSGLLNGREFECSWRESSAEIGLIPIDENDVQIPSGVFKPQEGDTFILWNLAMPQSSIDIAQKELLTEAINYIEELVTSITETDCTTEAEATRISGLNTKIKVGQRISVNSNVFRNGRLSSRIINFSYKLTKPYDISFTLASSRQTGRLATLQNLITDVTHEVHSVGQVQRAISRRQWHDTEEMMSMLDSIQKQMVVVGDENNSFTTTCNVAYNDTNKELFISKGYLQHQSYTDNEWKGAWLIEQDKTISMPALDEKGVTPFYVYFVCSKDNNTGYAEIGPALPQYNDNYVFVLGILSSEFEGKRIFNQSSGLTSIAGGTITTDVVQDPGRRLIIDYSNATIIARNGATIKGAIEFEKGEGENDLGTAIEGLLNGVNNAQSTANSASSKATQAQNTANTANSTANSANTKATQAQTTATNAQNTINNLKIGGTNLLLESDVNFATTEYLMHKYNLTIVPIVDKYYTITVWGQLGEGKTGFYCYNSGWSVNLCTATQKEEGVYSATFKWKNSNGTTEVTPTQIWLYAAPSSVTGVESMVQKIKLEEGTKGTSWTPAPEDVDAEIQEAKEAVDAVKGSVDTLNDELAKSLADGYISKDEQERLRQLATQIDTDFSALVAEYDDVRNSNYLSAEDRRDLLLQYEYTSECYDNYYYALSDIISIGSVDMPTAGIFSGKVKIKIDTITGFEDWSYEDFMQKSDDLVGALYEFKSALTVTNDTIRKAMANEAQKYADNAIENIQIGSINIIGRVSMDGQTHLYTNTAAQETLFGEEVRQVTKVKTGFGTLAKVEFNVKKGMSYVASVYYKNGTDLPSPTNNPARIIFSQEKDGVETTLKEYKTPPLSTEWAQMAITHTFNEDSSSTNKYYVQVSPHYTISGTTYFSCLKVQEGNKPTEGYEATISDVSEVNASIDAVSGSLDDVSAQLDDAFKDGYFNKTEQKALKASVGELENSYNAFVKEYLDVANSKYLDDASVTISGTSYTTPKTSLTTKYNALVSAYNNYHGVLQGLCDVKFGTITKPNIGTVGEVSIPNTDSRLTSVGIAFRDSYLTAYTNRVSEYKQALSVAQENIRVNMQKESESYADNKVDNLQIGGRNLLLDSNSLSLNDNTNNNYKQKWYFPTTMPTKDKTYTFSCKKSQLIDGTATEWHLIFHASSGGNMTYKMPFSDEPQTKTVTIGSNKVIDGFLIYAGLQGSTAGNNCYWEELKLEEGNKATGWTPAPEDVDAEIADAKKEAQDVSIALNSTDSLLNKSLSDGYIDANEKEALKKSLESLSNEMEDIMAELDNISSSNYLTDEQKSTLNDSYTILKRKHKAYYSAVYNLVEISISGLSLAQPKIQISDWGDDKYKTPKAEYESALSDYLLALSIAQEQMRSGVEDSSITKVQSAQNLLSDSFMLSVSSNASQSKIGYLNVFKQSEIIADEKYTFSVESSSVSGSGTKPTFYNFGYYEYYSGVFYSIAKLNISNSPQSVQFTMPIGERELEDMSFAIQFNEGKIATSLQHKLFGLMLVKGDKYYKWKPASQAEEESLYMMKDAMEGSTEIEGGLVMTNLIELKNQSGVVTAGISGLSSNKSFTEGGTSGTLDSSLRFWAGANLAGANTAPFRVYNDGRVFGTHFYGFHSAIELTTSNFNSSDTQWLIDARKYGSKVLLNIASTSKTFTFPGGIEYVGSEIEIFNPYNLKIAICGQNIISPTIATLANAFNNITRSSVLSNNFAHIYTRKENTSTTASGDYIYTIPRWSIKNISTCSIPSQMPNYMRWKCICFQYASNTYSTSNVNSSTYYTRIGKSTYVYFLPLWVLVEASNDVSFTLETIS